jgi:hypothetical protein
MKKLSQRKGGDAHVTKIHEDIADSTNPRIGATKLYLVSGVYPGDDPTKVQVVEAGGVTEDLAKFLATLLDVGVNDMEGGPFCLTLVLAGDCAPGTEAEEVTQ